MSANALMPLLISLRAQPQTNWLQQLLTWCTERAAALCDQNSLGLISSPLSLSLHGKLTSLVPLAVKLLLSLFHFLLLRPLSENKDPIFHAESFLHTLPMLDPVSTGT